MTLRRYLNVAARIIRRLHKLMPRRLRAALNPLWEVAWIWWQTRFPGCRPWEALVTVRRAIGRRTALSLELGFGLFAGVALIIDLRTTGSEPVSEGLSSLLGFGLTTLATGILLFLVAWLFLSGTRARVVISLMLCALWLVSVGERLGQARVLTLGPVDVAGVVVLLTFAFLWRQSHGRLLALFLGVVLIPATATQMPVLGLLQASAVAASVADTLDSAALVFVFLTFWAVVAGILSMSVLDFENWACVQIEGRGASHIFRACGKMGAVLAHQFLAATSVDRDRFEASAELMRFDGDPEEKDAARGTYERVWMKRERLQRAAERREGIADEVDALLKRQRLLIARLEGLKLVGARELGMPYRRFCDHVVQFSPTLYRELAEKYRDNWYEIARGGPREDPKDLRRAIGLIRENYRTRESIRKRGPRLEALEDFDYLAPTIVSVAAAGSTSGAVRRYAEALSTAFNETPLRSAWLYDGKKLKDIAAHHRLRALAFVWSKRRGYLTADPHYLLTALCRRDDLYPYASFLSWLESKARGIIVDGREFDGPGEGSEVQALERPSTTPSSGDTVRDPGEERGLGEADGGRRFDPLEFLRDTGSLRRLRVHVAEHMAEAHAGIAERLAETIVAFKTEIEAEGGALHLMTVGFSRTVRQALTGRNDIHDDFAAGWTEAGDLYLLVNPEGDSVSTRLMQFQLKRERSRHSERVAFHRIVAVSPEFAFQVPKPKDGVLILVGAKAWDDHGRVIATQGYLNLAARADLERRTGRGFGATHRKDVKTLVVAVGEEYKRMDSVEQEPHQRDESPRSFVPLSVSAEFYDETDDRVDLLGKGLVDKIITEDEVAYSRPEERSTMDNDWWWT